MEPFIADEPVNTAQSANDLIEQNQMVNYQNVDPSLAMLNNIPVIDMPSQEQLDEFIANQIANVQSKDDLAVIEFDARLLSKQALRSMPNIEYALQVVGTLLKIFKWNSLTTPEVEEEKKAVEPAKEEPAYKDSLESDHDDQGEKVDLNEMTDNAEQSLQLKLTRLHGDLPAENQTKIGTEDKEISTNALSASFIAGICLSDLLNNKDWLEQVFELEESQACRDTLVKDLAKCSFADKHLKSVHSRLTGQALYIQYSMHPYEVSSIAVGYVCDALKEGQVQNMDDANLRGLIQFLEKIEDEVLVKNFYKHVPSILAVIVQVYRREQNNKDKALQDWSIGQREKTLHILYLCFRCVSWADGIDNELVDASLDPTFNEWMNVFLEILPSQNEAHMELKHQALRCLTVIFRDFINYSRDCINLILKPAWQLLNQHLPVFTEVLVYNNRAGRMKMSAKHELDFCTENDFEEAYGTRGMTLQLIELLTTLVQRPSVQEVVRQGVNPLLMTVSSYMLIESRDEQEYLCDSNLFLHDKSQSVYKVRRIKNQCVDLFSSLIEIFGDQAISSILLVVEYLLNPPQAAEPKPLQEGEGPQIDLGNFSYNSENVNHKFKRRDAAMLIVGIFAEDIQMYCNRHGELDLAGMLEQIADVKDQPEDVHLRNVLMGRTLWCISSYTESLSVSSERSFTLKQKIIQMSLQALKDKKQGRPVKLIATRSLVRFARKMKKEHLQSEVQQFETVLDDLLALLNSSGSDKDAMHLPIEAFMTFSKINEQMVSKMAPKITPQLLRTFKQEHSEGSLLGQDLLNLFKQWCNYDECRDIFINTFLPFIVDIISVYYAQTANEENKHTSLAAGLQSLDASSSLSSASTGLSSKALGNASSTGQSIVDATILQHVLDLLCTLLRKTDAAKHPADFQKIIDVFPQLLGFVRKSEDMFLLLHGTAALKNFIFYGHEQVLAVVDPEEIVDTAKRLLSPSMNEQAAMCLGNLIIQIFHKIQPQIDTDLLFTVVQKIYKTRMPSTLQQLVLIFARLIHNHPEEIVELLSETSVDSRISLKVLLDKWLLQQALFRGQYTKTVTLTALFKLFCMRDSRIESLMVIGYNPSHSNINSEVNAPFKILSTLLRFLQSESMPKEDNDPVGGHRSPRVPKLGGGGERLDTVEGYNDLYDDEAEPDNGSQFDDSFRYGESDDEGAGDDAGASNKIEVNMDDLEDEQECLLSYEPSAQNAASAKSGRGSPGETGGPSNDNTQGKGSKSKEESQITDDSKKDLETCSDTGSTLNFKRSLFAVKESQDKGLADMETGSEVYMSELLAGFDMEDFDEAEEQNEEDLLQLGDSFAQVSDLREHIIELFENFILPPYAGTAPTKSAPAEGEEEDEDTEQDRPFKHGKAYVTYCMKQLNEDDAELAKQFLNPIFDKRRQLQRAAEEGASQPEESKQQQAQ